MIESKCLYLSPFGNIRGAYAIRPYSLPEEKAVPTYIFRRIKEGKGEKGRGAKPRLQGRIAYAPQMAPAGDKRRDKSWGAQPPL